MKKLLTHSLRHKVTLEKKTLVSDIAGGYQTGWQAVVTLWASINRLRGNERFTGGQLASASTHVFRMRFHSDISPDKRFIYDGRIFNIRVLHNVDEKDRMLDVYVEEGVGV